MLIPLPILIAGMNPSRLGGSTCNTRMGAMAGIGPEGGGVLGGCGGPELCSAAGLDEVLASDAESASVPAESVEFFNALMSSADNVLLFFAKSSSNSRSRSSAEGTVARAFTSSLFRTPWATINRNSGS